MILQCPECQARFAVPDAQIPPAGRTVKCGRCAHQWHAGGISFEERKDFADIVADEMEQTPPVNPSQLPVIPKPPFSAMPFIIATPLIAIAWLIMAFYAYYPTWLAAPVASGVYKSLGITSTEGLVFDNNISMQKNVGDGKTQFIVRGSISNHAAVDRVIPYVRVQLKDKNGKALWGRKYAVNETVEAGKSWPFNIDDIETAFAGSVTTIVLDLGHPLQMAMR